MSTNAIIAVKVGTEINGIYLHYDGGPISAGVTLVEHYQAEVQAVALVALGDCSSLGESIGTKHDGYTERPAGECTFYHRDRSEDWDTVKPKEFYDEAALLRYCRNNEICTYLFDGEWKIARSNAFVSLSEILGPAST